MYLAHFDDGETQLVQAAVRIRVGDGVFSPREALQGVAQQWLSRTDSTLALRTVFDGEEVRCAALLSCPARFEDSFEEALAALAGAELGANPDHHDEIARDFPRTHLGRIRASGYRARRSQLASDFRLFPSLDQIFLGASQNGWSVGYQANILRRSASQEDLRWLRKQLVGMELDKGFRADVLALQISMVERFASASFQVDELVGCTESTCHEFVQQTLDDEFAAHMYRHGFTESPFDTHDAKAVQQLVESGFSSTLLFETEPVTRVAAALERSQLAPLIGWRPPAELRRARPAAGAGAATVFVSYSSRNVEAAEAVAAALEERGTLCWVAPRDVVPGTSYPEAIMRGLRSCRAVVLLFSEDSDHSPHVQREVERAVSLGMPMVTMRLGEAIPTGAMEYLISSGHWIDSTDPPPAEDLARISSALRGLLGTS